MISRPRHSAYARFTAHAQVRGSRRVGFVLALTLACALPCLAPAEASTASADSAWRAGDFALAANAYRQVLTDNPRSVRAMHRLALVASWDGHLDSALTTIRRARIVEPNDVELQLAEARFLAWDNRFTAATALYDSVLARSPEAREAALGKARTLSWANLLEEADEVYANVVSRNPDDLEALAGRAQVAGWRGDPAGAIHIYRTMLERKPDNVDALLGLSRVHLDQGQVAQAKNEVQRALSIDPSHPAARELERKVQTSLRPQIDVTAGWSRDSDRNFNWRQSLRSSIWLGPGLRGFAAAGALQASDPLRYSTRTTGETGLIWAIGNLQCTGAIGARQLKPANADNRSVTTFRGVVTSRVMRSVTAGVGYSHSPLDDTALLIGRDLDLNALDFSLDAAFANMWHLSAGGGRGRLSDGNTRRSAVLSLEGLLPHHTRLGVFGRLLTYDTWGDGYFSPDRFTVFELRGSKEFRHPRWTGALRGGVGRQQVGRNSAGQFEWQFDARVGRRWATINRIEIFFQHSNSALSSTTGAYRSAGAGLNVALGF